MFRKQIKNLNLVFTWLFLVAIMVFAMMVIGAITRLSGSGLSIVEWRLIGGILPPMSESEWRRVFSLYQQTDQYRFINFGMSLSDFKEIFLWEYIHRLWGKLLGIFYVSGLLFFLFRGSFPRGSLFHFIMVMLLGFMQAFIGWWMVESGFVDRVSVAPYRLVIHLGLGFILWGYVVWLLNIIYHEWRVNYRGISERLFCSLAFFLQFMIFVLILSGGLVAGLDGGLVYNDWPLMGGNFIPDDYFLSFEGFLSLDLDMVLSIIFENPVSAQFHHRWLGALVVVLFLSYRLLLRGRKISSGVKSSANLLLFMLLVQFALGVLTLHYQVPLYLGVFHQAGAALVFACIVWHVRELKGTL